MNPPPTFRSIIELWSTRKGMAEDLAAVGANAGPDAVSKWWRRDSIPDEWWVAICKTGVAREAGVTVDVMARLASVELTSGPFEARP